MLYRLQLAASPRHPLLPHDNSTQRNNS